MSLAIDLIEQAEHLMRREPKRPKQASLRRATSAAYYAIFHLLTEDAASVLGAQLAPSGRAQLQRSFNHKEIRDVCIKFRQRNLPPNFQKLIGSTVSQSLQDVALAFIHLQEARHSADYDLNSQWNRARTQRYVQEARGAFAAWKAIRKSPEANVFLISFLLYKTLEASR